MTFLYYFISLLLLLIGQVHTVFAFDNLLQKGSIKELLHTYNQGKTSFLCTESHSPQTRFMASVLIDLTDPHLTKPLIKNKDNSSKYPCPQKMKPLQRLMILPPFLLSETNYDLTYQKKVWDILYSHFSKNRQLKIVSWDRMHSLSRAKWNSKNQEQAHLEKQNEEHLKLARLTDADAYFTTWIDERKTKIQVHSTQDTHLLWEKEFNHPPNYVNIFSMLDKSLHIMVQDFFKSFPYHGIQILDPLWQKAVFEKDFQNLAKIDVGSTSSIQKGDPLFWIEICRINKAPLFKDGKKVHILAKGEVLKKERGVLLAHITHYRHGLSDWKEKLDEGTLIVSANDKNSTSLAADQDTLRPIKNRSDKTRSRLTISTGVLSILILLALLL